MGLPLCARCNNIVKRKDKKYCSKRCYHLTRSINVSIEDLLDFYITKNKTRKQCCKHFKCTLSYLNTLIKRYKIPQKEQGYNLLNKKFKYGKVLNKISKNHSTNCNMWSVQCDCGKKYTLNSAKLNKIQGIMCVKCKNIEKRQNIIIPNYIYNGIVRSAKSRNIKWELDKESIEDLLKKQNFKCAITGLDIALSRSGTRKHKGETTISLDRIDSKKHYFLGNVQWVHKTVNRLKWNLSQEELIYWCKLVVNNN